MSAFEEHGALKVIGTQLCDKNDKPFQLKGPSTLGIIWYPQFINPQAFETIKKWGGNMVRLAMYVMEEDGYLNGGHQGYQENLLDVGVNAAVELGMYVIIDWHILSDGNPHTNKEAAKVFFDKITEKYKDIPNVLYEICNEPNGEDVTWPVVKSYAEEIIPVIRKNAPDSIVLVGTPCWSQDVDAAADDPLAAENVMYSLHYYAATHKEALREKATYALSKNLPIFITEYSNCDASGNGDLDIEQAKAWAKFTDDNNLGYAQWNLACRNESSSMIKVGCEKIHDWEDDDLTETGKWMRDRLKGII